MLHTFPQLAQFCSVPSCVSQPFAALLSQSAKPELHPMPLQTPATHCGVPPVLLQTFVHDPQWAGSATVLVSQPLPRFASQLPNPALHVMAQLPPLQLAEPLAALHTVVQLPQWPASALVFVSQPFVTLPSQLAKPKLQETLQVPEVQSGVPFWAPHTVVQVPQCAGSLEVLVSQPLPTLPSQLPNDGPQMMLQEPRLQLGVPFTELQALPQKLQWLELVCRFVSQPLTALPSQLPKPELQAIEHAPPTHEGVPLLELQALPQLPQFVVLVMLVSQPFATFASQSAKPGLHAMPHTPLVQEGMPLFALHSRPQTPQCAVLVRFASQPFVALPSQFANPVLQAMAQTWA